MIVKYFFCCCLLFLCFAAFSVEAKIVFCVDGDIWVMNDDGSGRQQLTTNLTVKDSYPRWSPDGKQIAFHRYIDKERPSQPELFIMNADGTDPQRLTDNNVFDGDPSWSPDGKRIAFTRSLNSVYQVFVLDVVTREVMQVTGIRDNNISAAPDWSPDGKEIVFERFIPVKAGIGPKTIYVMDADGQHQRPILPDPPLDGPLTLRFFPRWSADGQRVLYAEVKWLKGGDVEQFMIQRPGGVPKAITDINDRLGNNWLSSGACWMANDGGILFSMMLNDKPNPNYDLYQYTFDTRGLRRLTREVSDEDWPDWTAGTLSVSPHGKLPTQWGEIKQTY